MRTSKKVNKNKTFDDSEIVKKPRGRPKKEVPQVKETVKKPRGRPKKEVPQVKETVKKPRGRPKKEVPQVKALVKKPRGRPRKEVSQVKKPAKTVSPKLPSKACEAIKPKKVNYGKTEIPVSSKRVELNPIEDHPIYPAALWIQKNIPTHEEAYLKRRANKDGSSVLHSILEHMLGYFSITDSKLTEALRSFKKNNHTNQKEHTQYGLHSKV
jgi:hypothetical protein